jgi:hypothetical protein
MEDPSKKPRMQLKPLRKRLFYGLLSFLDPNYQTSTPKSPEK